MTQSTHDAIVRALVEGTKSYAEIGVLYGVSRQRVGQIAKSVGITRAAKRKAFKVRCEHCLKLTRVVPIRR